MPMEKKEVLVKAQWDDEAEVWVAESDDIPGLITEADTMEHLIKKLKVLIPELIEANRDKIENFRDNKIPFHVVSNCHDMAELSYGS
jgi:predicted RNase H-like HicB family nuclease